MTEFAYLGTNCNARSCIVAVPASSRRVVNLIEAMDRRNAWLDDVANEAVACGMSCKAIPWSWVSGKAMPRRDMVKLMMRLLSSATGSRGCTSFVLMSQVRRTFFVLLRISAISVERCCERTSISVCRCVSAIWLPCVPAPLSHLNVVRKIT